MSEFLAMGGYGFYVWTSLAVFIVVLAADALAPVLRRQRVMSDLRGRLKREQARGRQR